MTRVPGEVFGNSGLKKGAFFSKLTSYNAPLGQQNILSEVYVIYEKSQTLYFIENEKVYAIL